MCTLVDVVYFAEASYDCSRLAGFVRGTKR